MYDYGRGVPEDDTEAAKWYCKAAEQGNRFAQLFLGIMYKFGRGVPQDYVLAYMWLNLAAAQGSSGARIVRDQLALSMTPSQIAEAQRLGTREWKTKSGY
jgi:TPR repeat protein